MIRTKLFKQDSMNRYDLSLNQQINDFLEKNECKVIDIKFSIAISYNSNADETNVERDALLIYEPVIK